LAILGLFSADHAIWHADDINAAMGYARATGYRYVKDLVAAGLLQKVGAGRYALGARIIELDFQLRRSDPVLLASVAEMDALALRSGFDVVLSALFGRARVVDTHRVGPNSSLRLEYGRGRPRPLFQGAAPKVMLASLPRVQLKAIYESHVADVATAKLGATWTEFRHHMAAIRAAGFYLSQGELDPGVGAAAMAVLNRDQDLLGAVTLVGTNEALVAVGEARLAGWLRVSVDRIRDALP
jgi:DNA-binding IclR family transcriptional regulator